MDRNWMIRTHNNQILGPVAREKILELWKKGSLHPDDEICAGSGFWFFIREKDLVEKHLVANEAQHFNPISEARDVVSLGENEMALPAEEMDDITSIVKVPKPGGPPLPPAILNQGPPQEEQVFPAEADLEFPDLLVAHSHGGKGEGDSLHGGAPSPLSALKKK